MEKKLYKSRTDKKMAGVCGGFAEYFGIDSTIVRIIWFITSWFWGIGLIGYIACALIMKFPSDIRNQEIINRIDLEEEKNETIDPTSEIRKYKELLEDGIISEEEFDIKKKELLGI